MTTLYTTYPLYLNGNQAVFIKGRIIAQTDKAVLFSDKNGIKKWIPKSVCEPNRYSLIIENWWFKLNIK